MRYFIFQDESGKPGDKFFFSGALFIDEDHSPNLYRLVHEVRKEHWFWDELHFQKMSKKRFGTYKNLMLRTLSEIEFVFKAIVIRRERLDMARFGNKPYIVYNYFTRLLIYHAIKHYQGDIYIYTDHKNRTIKDNFHQYLLNSLNDDAFIESHGYRIRVVEPRSSRDEQLLQVADLFLGLTRQGFIPSSSKYKSDLVEAVSCHPNRWRKINVWDWKPKNTH